MSRRIERSKARREAKQGEQSLREETKKANLQSKNPGADVASIGATSKYSLLPSDLLKLFTNSFKSLFEREDLDQLIQTVKGDLYNRDYIQAFSDDERRMAYSVRWTPARALAYSSLFGSLTEVRKAICSGDSRVFAIGGGAGGELVALSSIFTQFKADTMNRESSKLKVDLLDIANWQTNVDLITKNVKETWLYEDPESLEVNFKLEDVLKMNPDPQYLRSLNLITLLFTTNELFSENRSLATKFLQSLSLCQKGCVLLITESAGSYSHIEIGTKKFPVQFLIDLILVGKDGTSGEWELIDQTDSCWYRCGADFNYPLKLENMRFFFRLYRKR